MFSFFFASCQSESILLGPHASKEFNEDKSCIYVAINPKDVKGTAYTKFGSSYNVFGYHDQFVVNFSSYGGKLVVENPSSSKVTFYYHKISFTGNETSATACDTYNFYMNPPVSRSFIVANSTTIRDIGMYPNAKFCYFYLGPSNFSVSFTDDGPVNSSLYVNGYTGSKVQKTINAQHAVSIKWESKNIEPSGYASAKIASKSGFDPYVTIKDGALYRGNYLCLGSSASIDCDTSCIEDYDIDDIFNGLGTLITTIIIIAVVIFVIIIVVCVCTCYGCCACCACSICCCYDNCTRKPNTTLYTTPLEPETNVVVTYAVNQPQPQYPQQQYPQQYPQPAYAPQQPYAPYQPNPVQTMK